MLRVYPLAADMPTPTTAAAMLLAENSVGTQLEPVECLLRVYIVGALELQSNAPDGLADPYIQLKIGHRKLDNRADYIPHTLNPLFGKYKSLHDIQTYLDFYFLLSSFLLPHLLAPLIPSFLLSLKLQ